MSTAQPRRQDRSFGSACCVRALGACVKPGEAQYTSNQHRLASLQVNAHDRVLGTHTPDLPPPPTPQNQHLTNIEASFPRRLSFFARRIHFPGAEKDSQIKKLLARLGRRADEVEAEALTAVRSAPFDPPERGRVAVKVITRTGMEMTSVVDLDASQ